VGFLDLLGLGSRDPILALAQPESRSRLTGEGSAAHLDELDGSA
jgi:hypothetical protein